MKNQETRNEKYETNEVIVATSGNFDAEKSAMACCYGAPNIKF